VSLDETEKEAGLATNASEEDEPSESGVAVAEAEVSTPGEVSELELENADEESANPVGLETEATSDDYHVTTPTEVLESVAEDVYGESSVSFDMKVSVPVSEPASETVSVSEIYDDSVLKEGDDVEVGNSIDFVPEEKILPKDNAIDNALDEEPIVTEIEAELSSHPSDVAEDEAASEANTTSLPSEEAVVDEGVDVSEEGVVDEEAAADESATEDEEAVVAEVGENGGEHIEAGVGSPAADAVERRDSVETPGKEASDVNEDNAAPVEVGTIAEESEAAAPEYEAVEFEDDAKEGAEVVEGDAELTKPMTVEAEQSVTERYLVSDLVGESMTIEVTEVSDEKVVASTKPAEWLGDQLESREPVGASEEFTVGADANDTEVADDQGGFELEIAAQVVKRTESNDDEEENEDEEIAFMEDLEDPEEVLRLAEQAAAAELLSLETR
ncbi:hypothetical protein PR001_g24099, partial [Phytophthora rubi]